MKDLLIRGKVEGDQKDKKRLASQKQAAIVGRATAPRDREAKGKVQNNSYSEAGGVAPCS